MCQRYERKKATSKRIQIGYTNSAKGMFDGYSIEKLEKRAARNKKSIEAAKKEGRGHAEQTKDLERVNFAIRAHKSKGGKGWHKPVKEAEDEFKTHRCFRLENILIPIIQTTQTISNKLVQHRQPLRLVVQATILQHGSRWHQPISEPR